MNLHSLTEKQLNHIALSEIVTALRDGSISARSLLELTLEKYETTRALIQPYKSFNPEHALKQAELADKAFADGDDTGMLQGIPISVKDLYAVDGYPTFAGSPMEIPASIISQGSLVDRITSQHGVITGKTHTVEFAFGGLGTNPHWGAPRNPWDSTHHRVVGGSSAGAGGSLWCGAYVAMGSDTAGSVRIPASMTGNVGMKTTYGRWSVDGVVPLSQSIDTLGFLTRTVADAAIAFEALDENNEKVNTNIDLSSLTIGVPESFFWEECSPGITDSVQKAISEIEQAGAKIIPFEMPELDPTMDIFKQGHLAAAELYEYLSTCLPDWLESLNPQVSARTDAAKELSACEYLWRVRRLKELAISAGQTMHGVDLLLTPTVAITPPTVNELEDAEHYRHCNMLSLRNTCIVNLLRLCAVSMPVGLDDQGLPVGMQLIAAANKDNDLIGMAYSIEKLLGNSHQRLGDFL
jgi:aspartyl-tRNA(Asn)/glutamyl-tRNA(Gln) amidotransferase subunit A